MLLLTHPKVALSEAVKQGIDAKKNEIKGLENIKYWADVRPFLPTFYVHELIVNGSFLKQKLLL
ncbi:hypothetical protein NIES19_25230 [Anabaena cylindrica PCC 7122]|nr:hypothetical protein NIES19_25230 [Anabaena cylindrica PCC 7122]